MCLLGVSIKNIHRLLAPNSQILHYESRFSLQTRKNPGGVIDPSHGLGLVVAGLRSLWLASRLKPWLKATRGLRQLMAASHGLQHHGNLRLRLWRPGLDLMFVNRGSVNR